MLRLLTLLITILMLPSIVLAWPGKIVAVEGATTFVVLKNGQTPVKVNIAGVKPSPNMDPAKARMESSNDVLMRDVEVRELSKTEDGTIIGDITVDGKSLSKELLDDGIVESSAQAPPAIDTSPVELPKEITEPAAPVQDTASQATNAPATEANADEIVNELTLEQSAQAQAAAPQPVQQPTFRPAQPQPGQVQYVQVYQAPQQQLGLWPGRPAAQPVQQTYTTQQHGIQPVQQSSPTSAQQTEAPRMQQPGDAAKQDYDLAVSVQKNSRRDRKPTGFFTKKRKSETYVGVNSGFHAVMQPKSNVPYENWGSNDAISIRHFFPSGLGIGGDFKYSLSNGRSGSYALNSTDSADYDYKKKSFSTYSLTASLLYRYYTGKNLTAYIGGSGGYAFFSHPDTEFHLSDGAPLIGSETGILYKFDSGFTIGGDINYTTPIGGKSDDPNGYLGTSLNIGYTFD